MPYSDQEKQREYHKQYKEKNKDKIKANLIATRDKRNAVKREWLLKNKDKSKKYCRNYYLKNIDKLKETSKERRKNNVELMRVYKSKYYQTNKEIIGEKQKLYYQKNRDKRLEQCKQYRLKKPHMIQKARLSTYGMTVEDYNKLLEKQSGLCAICKNLNNPTPHKKLFVDHCHKTNKVRGLLCSKCNFGLGCFSDETDFMYSAINYLNK